MARTALRPHQKGRVDGVVCSGSAAVTSHSPRAGPAPAATSRSSGPARSHLMTKTTLRCRRGARKTARAGTHNRSLTRKIMLLTVLVCLVANARLSSAQSRSMQQKHNARLPADLHLSGNAGDNACSQFSGMTVSLRMASRLRGAVPRPDTDEAECSASGRSPLCRSKRSILSAKVGAKCMCRRYEQR